VELARALYRDPFLVMLDEPNSNLDGEGEAALVAAIQSVRNRGGIVVLIAHRPTTLASVDMVALMRAGRLVDFGPRDEVMRKVMRQSQGSGQAPGASLPPAPVAAAPAGPQVAGYTIQRRNTEGAKSWRWRQQPRMPTAGR
jgi:ABC-type protease/lipase transport system fused ATPase/permease subunit